MTSAAEPRSAFSLITKGPFSRLWWASGVSSTGDWITIFATIGLGNEIAGGQGVLVAVFSRIVPGLVFGGAVGVLTDRADRRRLIMIADFGRAAVVPTLVFAGTLPVLVLITIVSEFLSILGQSPRAAIIPRLVRNANLVNANSLILGATYGTVPVGAGFNWFLSSLPQVPLSFATPETQPFVLAFLTDSLTFLVSGLIVATLPVVRTKAARAIRENGEAASTTREDFIAGARFLWTARSVRRVIASITASLFGGGVIVAVGPQFVRETLSAGTTGFFAVVTALGLGAGLGIGLISLYGTKLTRRDIVFGFATLVTSAGLGAAAFTDTVFGASSWIFVFGVGAGSGYVMGLTHLHEEVDDDMRGRVFAALFGLMRVGLFVSMLVAVPLEAALATAGVDAATRVVLLAGAIVIGLAGFATLWSLRYVLRRPKVDQETRDILAETTAALRRLTGMDKKKGDRE
ncbi:MAG: MFS transporter [Acidimicrobiia bacterium]